MKISLVASSLLIITLAGCRLTPEPPDLSHLSDAYLENKVLLTQYERAERYKRTLARGRAIQLESFCLYGGRPALDRIRMGCAEIKGSAEYKEAQQARANPDL
jgi:hypothetical protein